MGTCTSESKPSELLSPPPCPTHRTEGVEEDQARQLQATFQSLDKDGDEHLSEAEWISFLEEESIDPEADIIRQFISQGHPQGINLKAFMDIMTRHQTYLHENMSTAFEQLEAAAEREQELLTAQAIDEVHEMADFELDASGDSPCAVLGPVIGKVMENSARVLVEFIGQGIVTLEARPMGGGTVTSLSLQNTPHCPVVFVLENLAPGVRYEVQVQGAQNATRTGSFRTFHPTQPAFRVAAAACNKGESKRGKVNMFKKLYDEYIAGDKLDLLVHHGDQVYADAAFVQGEVIVKQWGVAEDIKNFKILQAYKKIYRTTWDAPDVRLVMSNVQNLMLWDDHEVRNDWGTFPQDTDQSSLDWRIAKCARVAYWQYQTQLWEDVPSERLVPPAYTERQAKIVTVTVKAGRELAIKDKLSKSSDPYAVVMLLDKDGGVLAKHKSEPVAKSLAPVWNFRAFDWSSTEAAEKHSVAVMGKAMDQVESVRIEVWDNDAIGKNDFMGHVHLKLQQDVQSGATVNSWFPLQPCEQHSTSNIAGSVNVIINFAAEKAGKVVDEQAQQRNEGSYHSWGPYGLLLLDGRGCRSFSAQPADARSFIGEVQWTALRDAFKNQFSAVRSLLVVHSMAPVLLGTKQSQQMGKVPPQVDKVGLGLHTEEQKEYLSMLFDWKASKAGRELCLVGGDMHFGIETCVSSLQSHATIQQVVTSAISNKPPPRPIYWMLRHFMEGRQCVGNLFGFDHRKFYYERNFGVFDCDAQGKITSSIVVAATPPVL